MDKITQPSSDEEKLLAIKALESEITKLRKSLTAGVTPCKTTWGSITSVRGRVSVDGRGFYLLLMDKGIDPEGFGELRLKATEANIEAALGSGAINMEEAKDLISISKDTVRVSPNEKAKSIAAQILSHNHALLEDK